MQLATSKKDARRLWCLRKVSGVHSSIIRWLTQGIDRDGCSVILIIILYDSSKCFTKGNVCEWSKKGTQACSSKEIYDSLRIYARMQFGDISQSDYLLLYFSSIFAGDECYKFIQLSTTQCRSFQNPNAKKGDPCIQFSHAYFSCFIHCVYNGLF